MRRLTLTQFLKTGAAYVGVSALTVDTGLLLADRLDLLKVPGAWYINAPLGAVVLVGIPASITLAARLIRQVDPNPGRISGFAEGSPSPLLRAIPFMANSQADTLFASSVPHIFGEEIQTTHGGEHRPAVWRVPVPPEGSEVMVRESELRAFLDVAHHRAKYQFSRRYWTRQRRPPLWRVKYEAYMRLLTESGLVEGRSDNGGASGWLVTHPRHAITYLKFESGYAIR